MAAPVVTVRAAEAVMVALVAAEVVVDRVVEVEAAEGAAADVLAARRHRAATARGAPRTGSTSADTTPPGYRCL